MYVCRLFGDDDDEEDDLDTKTAVNQVFNLRYMYEHMYVCMYVCIRWWVRCPCMPAMPTSMYVRKFLYV